MLKKQIVVVALTFLSSTLCVAVPGHTREQRLAGAKKALENRRDALVGAPTYLSEKAKEEAAEDILAQPHLKDTYRASLAEALHKLKNRLPADDVYTLAKPLDNLLMRSIDDIFEYRPGFISDASDELDKFPAWVTDAMSNSRALRGVLVYGTTAYGVYRLYKFFKTSHEKYEHEKELTAQPVIVVEP